MPVVISIEDARKLAEKFGGECLSPTYGGNETILLWKCKYGHIFESSYRRVAYKNRWCSQCKIEEAFNLVVSIAKEKGGLSCC